MLSATAGYGILRTDGLRLARDRFLIGTAVYVLGISVAVRWALPFVGSGVRDRWGIDLGPYYPLIVSHVVVQLAPLLVGIVGAFLLLEGRESHTVKALLVSPVPLGTYVLTLSVPMVLLSTLLTLVEGAIIGVGLPPWPALIVTGVGGALAAPMFALFVAAVADDKTQAFAYLKVCGVAPLIPTGSYFLAEPTQWLAGLYPPFWAVKAYWLAEAGEGGWYLWALAGLVMAAIWLALASRLFLRAARR